jgi:predicted nucleic acid-binding protein
VTRIRKAVIDTGPLLSALVLHYQIRYGRRSALDSLLREPLRIRDHQQQFLSFLAAIPDKLTTSHVIAELQGHVNSAKLCWDDRLNFWQGSIDLLMQWGLDERLIRLLDIISRHLMIADIGIVDTGLIELAARNNCVLITEDEKTLARRAWTEQIDCQLVKQLIPQV